jgi:phospholipid/cholesterol/gamma-HCH transport system substrate-binding protein
LLRRARETDSTATIKFTGLIGQNFVAIDFGSPSARRLEDNQYIETKEQADLNAIMAKVDNVAKNVENLTKSFTGDKIDNLLGPFTDFLKQTAGRSPPPSRTFNPFPPRYPRARALSAHSLTKRHSTTAPSPPSQPPKHERRSQTTLDDARKIINDVNAEGIYRQTGDGRALYNETTASMTYIKDSAMNLKEVLEDESGQVPANHQRPTHCNAKLTCRRWTRPPKVWKTKARSAC